ncbi:MAG TPA: cation transporter [Methanosarcinales archaeon]|nr:cation transporter [Methanosarcinales archaeon]
MSTHHNHNNHGSGLRYAIGITSAILIVELVGGVWTNSLALLSDAAHAFTDILALLLSWFAMRISLKPATPTKTYGYYRSEFLAALVNGIMLFAVSAFILIEAYHRIQNPGHIKSPEMVVIALAGLAANLLSAYYLQGGSSNINVRAALYHVLGDALASIGVITGGVLIWWTGWYVIDPVISVVICGIIVIGGLGLVRESVNILMEGTPAGMGLNEVAGTISSVEGVSGVHDLHLWCISPEIPSLSAHVMVDDIACSRADTIRDRINDAIVRRFGVVHTTLQFECSECGHNTIVAHEMR